MVSRALYNFQAQNYRELSFKKGDLVYIRRQVIWFFDHEFIKFWKMIYCYCQKLKYFGIPIFNF